MNGNDLIEWEESNAERLDDEFKKKYANEWCEFVVNDYNNKGN